MSQELSRKFIGFIILILVYATVNIAVVGVQKLYHHKDQSKLNRLKTYLTTERSKIKNIELSLSDIKNNLINLKQNIKNMESQYRNGIPALAKKIGGTWIVVPIPRPLHLNYNVSH